MIDLETVQRELPQERKTDVVDLNKYKDFVEAVTSDESNSTSALVNSINELENSSGVNMALLLSLIHI